MRAEQDGVRREAESNIQALRNKLEQQRNQYEEKLDNERALHEAARREAEQNIQAIRDTMDQMRNNNEEKFLWIAKIQKSLDHFLFVALLKPKIYQSKNKKGLLAESIKINF